MALIMNAHAMQHPCITALMIRADAFFTMPLKSEIYLQAPSNQPLAFTQIESEVVSQHRSFDTQCITNNMRQSGQPVLRLFKRL